MKNRVLLLSAVLVPGLLWPAASGAHGGVTPSQVITDMKHKQKGPYAAPIFRGRSLSQDWLGFQGENYRLDDISGVFIQKVQADGIADSEDLEQGDIIIGAKIGNQEKSIHSLADLDDLLAAIKEPTEVEFILLRDGKQTDEDVYLVPNLEEVAPEMADIMQGKSRPQPGMMMDKMMAQTPIGNLNKEGRKIRPGMFMEEMMGRSPLGPRHNIAQTSKASNLLEHFLAGKLQEITLYKQYQKELGVSDKQLEALHELQLEYKKQRIKNDAKLKIRQIELDNVLQGETDLDKLEDALEDLDKAKRKKHEQALKFLKEYFSTIDEEQRLKLKKLMGN